MKVKFLFIMVAFTYGCSVPNTKLFVDNSLCLNSLTSAVIETVKPDLTPNEIVKMRSNFTNLKNSFKKSYMGQELSQLNFSAEGTYYSYLFQNDKNICSLKLYKKKSKDLNYENTITFIESSKLEGCKCGKNNVQIQLSL